MTADRLIVATTIAAASFALGMDYGTSKPVVCPDKSPNEQLVSITINGPTTICTYASQIGRATRKAVRL